jgi:adenine/guanine phosphoribosyltransferase-like PRPP-binding protein
MDEKRKGTFSRHLIKDPEMRDVLDMTLKASTDKYAQYANKINGQNILIIDDTISRGQTIQ